jgi:5-formyltetrahydrofolate cyclo-ligase
MTPSERKAELRRSLRAEAQRHCAEERTALSEQLCRIVEAQPVWRESGGVLFFMPLGDEPDIRPLITKALAEGKTTVLPRHSGEQERYVGCRIVDLESELKAGTYGIPEPIQACPVVDLNKLDFLLIPGVGFSLNGRRLGRGKGHYDRLLAEAPGLKCGVAFDWQLTVEVPTERHDILLDCIVTPTRWHLVAG